jgi:non-heme chloroperoxidase
LFTREDQDRVVAAIRGSRFWVYPETGHCPNWEYPELVAADLKAFLRET